MRSAIFSSLRAILANSFTIAGAYSSAASRDNRETRLMEPAGRPFGFPDRPGAKVTELFPCFELFSSIDLPRRPRRPQYGPRTAHAEVAGGVGSSPKTAACTSIPFQPSVDTAGNGSIAGNR